MKPLHSKRKILQVKPRPKLRRILKRNSNDVILPAVRIHQFLEDISAGWRGIRDRVGPGGDGFLDVRIRWAARRNA
jgi:hypothetical protein